MKIIGGKDYYDKGLMYGVDDTILLIRKVDTVANISYFPPMIDLPYVKNSWSSPTYERIFVVIGDKIYSGVLRTKESYLSKDEYVWSKESYLKLLEKYNVAQPGGRGWFYGKQNTTLDEYFEPKQVEQHVVDYMIDNKVSILLSQNTRDRMHWLANPPLLEKVEFYKAVDAFSLYRMIDMWASGVLSGPTNKTVEIKDDKIKIAKHGFDVKTSFRKPKQRAV